MTAILQLLTTAKKELGKTSETPDADAEILLCHTLGCDRAYLYTWPEKQPEQDQIKRYEELIQRRQQGEPVAYLTGKRSFWDFTLSVSPATLIPRPETELLVEQALTLIPENSALDILDLGAGTGAIALAIAHERPACNITAVEYSKSACTIAEKNIHQFSKGNIRLLEGNWFSTLNQQPFDIIISNPPYIAERDPHLHQGDVQYEPTSALSAGEDGLDAIRHIILNAPKHLRASGWLLLEHGYDQANVVNHLFLKHGFKHISHLKDLSNNPRITLGQFTN